MLECNSFQYSWWRSWSVNLNLRIIHTVRLSQNSQQSYRFYWRSNVNFIDSHSFEYCLQFIDSHSLYFDRIDNNKSIEFLNWEQPKITENKSDSLKINTIDVHDCRLFTYFFFSRSNVIWIYCIKKIASYHLTIILHPFTSSISTKHTHNFFPGFNHPFY